MEYIKKIKKIIYNNSNIKILNILKQFNIKIKYYDIGASGGLQPRANNFIEVLNPIFYIDTFLIINFLFLMYFLNHNL